MPKVLLVDDDKMITGPLSEQLKESGYAVSVAHDGRSGLDLALQEKPDVVILDVMMPGMDGWEVCRSLRQRSVVPILMLTARGQEIDRVLGLELGADDYLIKPFSTRELVARLRALRRRVQLDQVPQEEKTRLSAGPVLLQLDTRQAFVNGQEVTLRYKEFELLSLLVSRASKVVSRADLFDQVWGTDWLGDTRTLDVHIRWLREKVEEDASDPRFIQTVRGVGYMFQP